VTYHTLPYRSCREKQGDPQTMPPRKIFRLTRVPTNHETISKLKITLLNSFPSGLLTPIFEDPAPDTDPSKDK
jgi:hypothetical protein